MHALCPLELQLLSVAVAVAMAVAVAVPVLLVLKVSWWYPAGTASCFMFMHNPHLLLEEKPEERAPVSCGKYIFILCNLAHILPALVAVGRGSPYSRSVDTIQKAGQDSAL